MLDNLDLYYRDNGISVDRFNCAYEHSCVAAATAAGGKFTRARAPKIGSCYLHKRPRIVVVSIDSGSDESGQGIRIVEVPAKCGAKNKHWYRTHEGVATILNALAATDKKMIRPEEAALWFAHTSVARCSANLPRRTQAPSKMHENCRRYLKGEIELLAPDIIWSQGKRAYEAMMLWIAPMLHAQQDRANLGIRIAKCRWGEVIWVNTSHPTARNPKGQNKWKLALDRLRSIGQTGPKTSDSSCSS